MFLNLILRNAGVLNQIGLVVLDEAQFITDPGRGIVGGAASYSPARSPAAWRNASTHCALGGHRQYQPFRRMACLQNSLTAIRPVPLIEGVLDRSGQFQFVDADGKEQLTQLLPYHAIQVRETKPSAQDVIVPLVQQLVRGTTEKLSSSGIAVGQPKDVRDILRPMSAFHLRPTL